MQAGTNLRLRIGVKQTTWKSLMPKAVTLTFIFVFTLLCLTRYFLENLILKEKLDSEYFF